MTPPEPEGPARPRWRRRWLLLGLAAVAVLAAGGIVYALVQGRDVSNPDVEFDAETPTPTATPTATPGTKKPTARQLANKVTWPVYGFSPDRRQVAPPVPDTFRNPFKRRWTYVADSLVEFPPVMAGSWLYVLPDSARMVALDKETGETRWARQLGKLSASSPAYRNGRLYATILERRGGRGRVVALRASDGKILWSRDLPGRTESSPIVADGAVYFGAENGTVYALRESDGGVRWTHRAPGPVKGGLALSDGKLFFGDYAGNVTALNRDTGRQVWRTGTSGARFGLSAGRFYATPAVAYGRVYVGNVDGNVYAFSARTGRLAWRTKTSGYVYGAAAVGTPPGGKPTVWVGSYDGTFYALDAKRGSIRWSHDTGGRISGAATLIGGVVYFSILGRRHTLGLGARTGKQVFEFPRGGYTPALSDGRTLFLVGYGAMYALRPLNVAQREAREKRQQARKRRARERRQAIRTACTRRAKRLHRGSPGRIRRSTARCVKQRT